MNGLSRDTAGAALDADQIALADRVEAAAWADMFAVGPAAMGLKVMRFAGATAIAAPPIPLGMFNRVIGLGAGGPVRADDIDAIVEAYRAAGAPKVWIQATPVTAPALLPLLESRGFSAADPRHWVKAAFADPAVPAVATPFSIGRVGPEHAQELAAVLVTAHSMPAALAPWIVAMLGHPAYRAYAASEHGRIVAGGFLHLAGGHAWLGMAGTLPQARGRGAQGAIIQARVADARAAGASMITTETWDPVEGAHNSSLANMLRTGFRKLCLRSNWELRLKS